MDIGSIFHVFIERVIYMTDEKRYGYLYMILIFQKATSDNTLGFPLIGDFE
jgi:hypothetical protein